MRGFKNFSRQLINNIPLGGIKDYLHIVRLQYGTKMLSSCSMARKKWS